MFQVSRHILKVQANSCKSLLGFCWYQILLCYYLWYKMTKEIHYSFLFFVKEKDNLADWFFFSWFFYRLKFLVICDCFPQMVTTASKVQSNWEVISPIVESLGHLILPLCMILTSPCSATDSIFLSSFQPPFFSFLAIHNNC